MRGGGDEGVMPLRVSLLLLTLILFLRSCWHGDARFFSTPSRLTAARIRVAIAQAARAASSLARAAPKSFIVNWECSGSSQTSPPPHPPSSPSFPLASIQ